MSKKASDHTIRGGIKEQWVGRVAGGMVWTLLRTLEVRVENASGLDFRRAGPVIFCVWHDAILGAPLLAMNLLCGRPHVVLTSASRDGAMLAAAVSVFGLGAARGSSSRRGAQALAALRRALRSGSDVTITPDGPRGPRRRLQDGVIRLAAASGAPVLPLTLSFRDACQLRSWDRMSIPKPFSQLDIRIEKALEVPAGLDDSEFVGWRDKLRAAMPPED